MCPAQATSHQSLTLSSLRGNFLLLIYPFAFQFGEASQEGFKYRQLSATVQEDKQDNILKHFCPSLLNFSYMLYITGTPGRSNKKII